MLEKDGNVPDGYRNYALKDTVKETMKEASGIMPEEFRHFCAESLKLGEAGWRLGEAADRQGGKPGEVRGQRSFFPDWERLWG